MKKLLNFGYSALLFSMLISCSQEEFLNEHNDNNSRDTSPYRVSLNEALRHADRLLGHLEGGKTRARMIESVKYYETFDKTRSSDTQDTTYYIVNYANEGGFAILSADKRLDPVYAISDEGHLDISDTTYNEGLKMYFEALDYAASNRPDTMTGRQEDMLPQPAIDIIGPESPNPGGYVDKSIKVFPMISPAVRCWGQDDPFNSQLHIGDLPCFLVGCAPVAIGQLMSYYKTPKHYGNLTFDWDNLILLTGYDDIKNSLIPQFLNILGSTDNLSTVHGYDSSSTDTKRFYKRTFKNMGYNEPGDFKTFTAQRGYEYIRNHKPILIRGDRNGTGHVWVIDGLIYDWYESPTLENGEGGDGLLLHCVWGWDGYANGYFKFDGKITPFYNHTDPEDRNIPYNPSKTLYYKLEFCGDFNPKQ